MRFKLLKNTACIAIISCALGMGGCTTYQEEDYDVYAPAYAEQPACLDNNGMECVMISDSETALYLPSFSEQTYVVASTQTGTETKTYYGSQNGTDLSSSAPVADEPVSTGIKSIETIPAVKIKPVEPTPVETKVVETTVAETIAAQETKAPEEQPVPPVQDETVKVKTQTIQSKTIEVKEETTTATMVRDTSLGAKASYGEQCHDWEAKIGDTLRGLLMQWGGKAGWTVIWKLDRDYHLEAGVIFRGTFTEVSGALIRSFARATPAPIGTFYKGNRVLVISTQEDENAN